ncbi:MAG: YgiQ family radical SAM protein [Gammaproteobacteria bacterium]|nr:YgiQ family radical SAM protein [Gammaproteobacteria bacterium]
MLTAPDLFSYRRYWAERFGTAPVLPLSRAEMDELGWDSCDVILVTGDAYVDHPSFGMALIGRLLESQGFRVGIIAQPDWRSVESFRSLGRPNLFFGVTAGNMDSMVNHYTADRRIRSNDAYTPGGEAGRRPDRAVVVYSQRSREAFPGVPVIIGGIEASLRRIAHYDYWSDKVRRSVLLDAKADLLIYGNGERAVVELAHRLAAGESISTIDDIRGTALMCRSVPEGWLEIDSTQVDMPGPLVAQQSPYTTGTICASKSESIAVPVTFHSRPKRFDRSRTVVRLPGYEQVSGDKALYAHASRVFHLETNPGNARALVQRHGQRELWLNPPPVPLETRELDRLYEFPYTRRPHPAYGTAKNPAWEMIRFSIPIMRGCFGGCTFCSITEHEGRIIQSRSEDSVIREIETLRDSVPEFTGVVSDLGGPTANMYRLRCQDDRIESACRRLSCVFPDICPNLSTDHQPLVRLYRRARMLPGIKRVLIASGLRYDLAVRDPEYVRELVTHHVGGYLKIAPEHTEPGPLEMMMKPGIRAYDRFKKQFDRFSREAGKEQYLIPYFIAAHPGTADEDMLNLSLWLKRNDFRLDQVQAFLPTPLALATAMYHSGHNPLRQIRRGEPRLAVPKGLRQRRLHKALLRWHDPQNWPMIREALKRMGRGDLIGNGKRHLVPAWQPKTMQEERRSKGTSKPPVLPPKGSGKRPKTGRTRSCGGDGRVGRRRK